MGVCFDLLRAKLAEALKPYGAKSEFCRKIGIDRSLLEKWLAGESAPSIESLEKIATGLGVPPWELLRPEGAQPTPQVREHTLADCKRAVDAALERQIAADAETHAKATTKEPEEEKEK